MRTGSRPVESNSLALSTPRIGPRSGPLILPLMGPPTPPLMGPPGGGGPVAAGLGPFALVRRSAGRADRPDLQQHRQERLRCGAGARHDEPQLDRPVPGLRSARVSLPRPADQRAAHGDHGRHRHDRVGTTNARPTRQPCRGERSQEACCVPGTRPGQRQGTAPAAPSGGVAICSWGTSGGPSRLKMSVFGTWIGRHHAVGSSAVTEDNLALDVRGSPGKRWSAQRSARDC